ncbi:MAG: hypothetical protein RRY33_08755 [Alistipes sp.]
MHISDSMYSKMFNLLCDAIDGQDYYSGTVSFLFEDVECRLTLSVIVYRQLMTELEGTFDPITNMIQVGAEFHTYKDNEEVPNDFQFSELRSYI